MDKAINTSLNIAIDSSAEIVINSSVDKTIDSSMNIAIDSSAEIAINSSVESVLNIPVNSIQRFDDKTLDKLKKGSSEDLVLGTTILLEPSSPSKEVESTVHIEPSSSSNVLESTGLQKRNVSSNKPPAECETSSSHIFSIPSPPDNNLPSHSQLDLPHSSIKVLDELEKEFESLFSCSTCSKQFKTKFR